MALGNTRTRWGWPARLLHWGMAGLILFQLSLGFWMVWLVTNIYHKFQLYQLHKSWGFVIFTLALIRIVWRRLNPPPDLPEHMDDELRSVAQAMHITLYVLMILLPLTGWLLASASTLQDDYGLKNMVFGLFTLPDPFVPGSKQLAGVFKALHDFAAFGLCILLLGHVAAALKHQFRDRDGLLRRMILGR